MHTWTRQKRPTANASGRRYITKKSKCALRMAWGPKVVALAALYIAFCANPTASQTLNDAVTNQLSFGPALTQPCFELLANGGQPIGSLQDVCTRSAPLPGAGPSVSVGGGAATPATLPAIVQKRLRETRNKKNNSKRKAPTARTGTFAKHGGRLNIFYSGKYNGLDRMAATSENSYDLELRRLTASTGYPFTGKNARRPKERRPKIVNVSYPSSRTDVGNHQPDPPALPSEPDVMGAGSGAANRKPVTFKIATGPLRLRGVEIEEATANSAIIQIKADQPVVAYKTFILSDPPRIVIDITGALFGEHMSRKKAGKGPIKHIRASQYRRKPELIVRVVLDLTTALPYQVAGSPDTFRLMIGDAVTKADKVSPPQPPSVTEKKPKSAPEELRIVTEPEPPLRRSIGVWGTGEYEDLDRDRTTFEDGYDSDIWRVTVGADYNFTEWIVAGLAFDYYRHDGDFKSAGNFQIDSYGILGFASFLPLDNVWVQVSGGYSRINSERTRFAALIDTRVTNQEPVDVVSGLLKGDYNGNEYRAGALAGYDFYIKNFIISPRIGITWDHREYDTYSEKGNTTDSFNNFIESGDSTGLELTFHDDDQTLLQSRLGVQGSIVFRTGFGMIAPQVSFDWRHEFENDQRDVEVSFVEDLNQTRFSYKTAKPERNWYEINAGVVAAFDNQIQVFGNYRTITGHSFFDSHAGTIGLRYLF